VEDLCAVGPLTARELSDLQIAVASSDLMPYFLCSRYLQVAMPICPTHAEYVAHVKAAGFAGS
jgi:hypothetical protein